MIDPQVDFSQYDSDDDGMVDMVYFIVPGLGSTSRATTPACFGLMLPIFMNIQKIIITKLGMDYHLCAMLAPPRFMAMSQVLQAK